MLNSQPISPVDQKIKQELVHMLSLIAGGAGFILIYFNQRAMDASYLFFFLVWDSWASNSFHALLPCLSSSVEG